MLTNPQVEKLLQHFERLNQLDRELDLARRLGNRAAERCLTEKRKAAEATKPVFQES